MAGTVTSQDQKRFPWFIEHEYYTSLYKNMSLYFVIFRNIRWIVLNFIATISQNMILNMNYCLRMIYFHKKNITSADSYEPAYFFVQSMSSLLVDVRSIFTSTLMLTKGVAFSRGYCLLQHPSIQILQVHFYCKPIIQRYKRWKTIETMLQN